MKKRVILLSIAIIFCLQVAGWGEPLTAGEYFDKGTSQYLMGDLDGALESLRAALKIDPSHAGSLELMKSVIWEQEQLPAKAKPVEEKPKETALAPEKPPTPAAPAPAPATSATPTLIAFLIALNLGILGLGALIFILSRNVRVKVAQARRETYCFKCQAKIPANVELCPNCGARLGRKMWDAVTDEQKRWYRKMSWYKNPFTMDVHPELFTGYKNEVKQILEKVSARSGHILVTGALGSGKPALLRWLTMYLSKEAQTVYISRPPLEFSQLIKYIVLSMGFTGRQAGDYDIYHLDQLRRKIGKHLILLMDEAHEFTVEIERPLRTLGDMDEVKMIMTGLPETTNKLKKESLPLYERLALQVILEHLEFDDIKDLIRLRIENSGGNGFHPFTTTSIEKIYEISKGNPRATVRLCDKAVTKAINDGEERVTPELILSEAEE